jgi:hypothetical protein
MWTTPIRFYDTTSKTRSKNKKIIRSRLVKIKQIYVEISKFSKKNKMSTTASTVSPSSYVIPHPVTDANPGEKAMQAGAARNEHQHAIFQISKGKIGGGSGKNKKNKNKNKKSKKYTAMKKRFSQRFRRSILRRKSRKMSLHKKNKKASLHGGSNDNKLTIPSFRQTSPTATGIINQMAGNNAQTIAYSAYDHQVSKPVS